MGSSSFSRLILPALITILALVDGVLHFMLDFVLFSGKLWGSPNFGPPPGGPPGGGSAAPPPPRPSPPPSNPILHALNIANITGLPLNELFVLNAIGYVVLVVVFWFVHRRLPRWLWLVDVVIIGYALTSIIGWLDFGSPNPNGLGYLAKAIEVVLIVVLLGHIWRLFGRRAQGGRAAPAPSR